MATKLIKLAVTVGYEVRANMWVYHFHNCVGESEKALLVLVSAKGIAD